MLQAELEKSTAAIRYLNNRHITQASIKEFLLGYCPNDVKRLLAFAQKQGILATNFIDAHILHGRKTRALSPF